MKKVSLNHGFMPTKVFREGYLAFRGAWLVHAGRMRTFGCVTSYCLHMHPDPTCPAPFIRELMKNPG